MSDLELELILRSCLTSVKDQIPLSQIESDLLTLTGTQIPYKNLGYPSLETCIKSSGEFNICNLGGISIVYAVPSNKTQHLTDLIKKQKSKQSGKKKNLKIQQFKKINTPKSKKRKISECINLSLYDEITKYYESNDINKLLSSIKLWDIETVNQFKSINNFECLVCCFQTNKFNCWKLHIMSLTHLLKCNKSKDLYSYVCSRKGCKVLLYGPKNSLITHKAKHSERGNITGVSFLMAEVMKRFITNQNGIMYYCSHCKKYAEKLIHTQKCKTRKLKWSIEYYCKYCRVDFNSCPEMIDYHSLSVEHLTLKCFDKMCFKTQGNFKKMKTCDQLNENKKKNLLPTVQNEIISNSISLFNVEGMSTFNNSDSFEVMNELQTIQFNRTPTNVDFGYISLEDQKSQVLNPIKSEISPIKIIDERSKLDIMSTSDEAISDNVKNLENEKTYKCDEDQAYGKYVTQRLKNIQNSNVKQDIKLEIDHLFYIQVKKMLLKSE